MKKREVDWNRMFALDLAPVRPAKNPHECCDACREAREIKCVCAGGGKNHGANRAGMSPLDKLLQLDGLEIEFPIGLPKPDELATW
jgi:hypothetical protein